VLRGDDIEGFVLAAFDVDDFLLVKDGVPGAVGGFVFIAAYVFDVDVLDLGAEVGEAPGYMLIVSDDDERNAWEGDSGDVEVCGFEVGFVPDAGNVVGEVHVVGDERLVAGGVGTGDDPVAGAGEASVADGIAEGLLEGEEVRG